MKRRGYDRREIQLDDKELKELQDPTLWEHSENDKRDPVKSSRAVVSVAFSRNDFELVSSAAKQRGMKTSEFIRAATLENARAHSKRAVIVSVSGSLEVRTPYPVTQLRGARVQFEFEPKLVMAGKS
jgi:hypothetical protein